MIGDNETSASATAAAEASVPATQADVEVQDNAKPHAFVARIAASRLRRDTLLETWKESVDFRVQAPYLPTSNGTKDATTDVVATSLRADMDQDRVAVAEDWSRTKQKTAQLMFQVPRVIAKAQHPDAEQGAPIFSAKLNQMLGDTGVKAAFMIDECLADVINAAGIMASVVTYENTTETKSVPDPAKVQELLAQGAQMPAIQQAVKDGTLPIAMVPQTDIIAQWYTLNRLSPSELLWPAEFKSSDWDKSPWLGYDSAMPTTEVLRKWGPDGSKKLPEGWKPSGSRPDTLADDLMTADQKPEFGSDYTKVSIIYYKGMHYRPDVKHPDCIYTMIFVEGCDQPVVDEPCKWQKWIEPTPAFEGHYVGITDFPIRVDTLVYVSDLATPPSDSEAGRPQVRQLMRFEEQQLKQRDHSIPVRWFDSNLVDEDVQEQLKNGTYQDWIPMNGPGDRAVGEVARANYPRENMEFERQASARLDRSWSMSNNQMGTMNSGRRSAKEAGIVADAADVRLEYEKNRVERFLLGNVRVLAGLMQMFETRTSYVQMVGEKNADRLMAFNNSMIANKYAFELIPDSSEHLDVETKINRALKTYNLMANSQGFNKSAMEKEILELMGYDPARFVAPPVEGKPDAPNLSFRFSGEDIASNPIALAVMIANGYKITPELLKTAQLIIESAHVPAPSHVKVGEPPATPDSPVTPPDANEPILKRSESGERLMGGV
jgi:hypothetical protein